MFGNLYLREYKAWYESIGLCCFKTFNSLHLIFSYLWQHKKKREITNKMFGNKYV